jgi:hypothetical protein
MARFYIVGNKMGTVLVSGEVKMRDRYEKCVRNENFIRYNIISHKV